MTTIKAFIKGHPLLGYFALAFAISWGTILLAVGLGPGGVLGHPTAVQDGHPLRGPGDAPRPQRGRHPPDWPPLRQGRIPRARLPAEEVAGPG